MQRLRSSLKELLNLNFFRALSGGVLKEAVELLIVVAAITF